MVTTTSNEAATAFPADWNELDDPNATFTFDLMHFPFPMNPLTESTVNPSFSFGFTAAAREYKTPILDVQAICRNRYHFERYVFAHPASEEEGRAMGEAAEAAMKPELGRLRERWQGEHLPAIHSHLRRLRTMDIRNASPLEIAQMLDEADAIHRDLWTIHFRIAIPMLLGMQIFDEFYSDVFGAADADGHALLVGVMSESVKAGMGLYDLSVGARDLGLATVFLESPSDKLVSALGECESGRVFLSRLNAYLDDYGLRQDMFDFATPTWQEDPAFALSSVRNYLQSGRDPRSEYETKARGAEAAANSARETLAAYPEAVRGQFEGLLQIARHASFLQEEHNFYIDQQGLSLLRLFYVAVGKRLVADGVLEDSDDVFLLQADELKSIFRNPHAAQQVDHVRGLVRRRREEMAIAQTLVPPPFIGAPPAGPPPTGNPMERAIGRFFGGPPQQSEASNEIKGNAGSRGTVTGIARVARTLDEATHVLPGEILVAVTTMPAWTPLFGVAAAVVTETGGPLSHCAIVAREYGIPAVVGAHGATRIIATGQRITVDGGRGVVTLDA